ncbi:MAG: glutathione S-transferase family protein [Thiolinea sp.]
MNFTLYNYVLSGNCYKVRLLASLLQIDYELIAVDFHPGKEHKTETFLQLNPAGTLPVLTANDLVLTESSAMLVWLAAKFDSSGQWYPTTDPMQLAQITQWLGIASELSATVGELRLHTMLNQGIDDIVRTKRVSIDVLRRLESHLCEQAIMGKQWLVGDHPTIADIACFPYAALSPDAGIEHDAYPAMRNWLYEVRALEGFVAMPGIQVLHELR